MDTVFTAEEEQRYAERGSRELQAKLRWTFLVAATLFFAFMGLDYQLDPEKLGRNMVVRLLAVGAYLVLHLLVRWEPARARVELLLLAGVGVGAASVTRLSVGLRFGEMLAVGSLLLMVVMLAALTTSLRHALISHGLLLAVVNVLGLVFGASHLFFFAVNVFLTSGAAAGVILAALSERLARRSFRLELDLEVLATRDSLTGAHNRRSFLQLAERELDRARRTTRPVSLLMVDIDRFKSINDTHGHPAGDAVIRTLASTSQSALRSVDVLGRLGGEEFAIILPETGAEGALRVAERLRQTLSEVVVPEGGKSLAFTVSVGVAEWLPGERLDMLLSRGDQALYAAKNTGRNRVCAAAHG
ncbi:GGDEF domain-containing protein [Pyxidicoccus sp. 3LFB2]